jgi:hypothetical protein
MCSVLAAGGWPLAIAVYSPSARLSIAYRPASSVLATATALPAVSSSVIRAPGTGRVPAAAVTVPVRRLPASARRTFTTVPLPLARCGTMTVDAAGWCDPAEVSRR